MEMAMVHLAKPEINDSTSNNDYKVYKRRYLMASFFAFSTVINIYIIRSVHQ
jgi:FLVCR family feline leukemia virus subgroup C receptor-related protein